MKVKIIAILVSLMVIGSHVQAQEKGVREDRLEAQKVAFITTQLDLTQEEAKVFWPVYNEYQGEQKGLKKSLRELGGEAQRIETLSEEEAGKLIGNMLSLEEKEIELKRRYVSKLEPTIGNKKIAVLFTLEREFREKVLRTLKRRMRDRR